MNPSVELKVKLIIPWDYRVLAATGSKVLVEIDKGRADELEYVLWDYNQEGQCCNGVYLKQRDSAVAKFKDRAFQYL